jgi:hypothetical protein
LNGQNTGYKSAATPGNTKITYGCLNTESESCKTADAVRYIAHPCYTPSDDQDHDDIALIELRAPVEGMAGQFAWVNGLNGSISIGDGEDVILAGFGATQQNGGGQTKVLMEVTVAKRPTSICERQNPSAVRKQYVNYNNVICTGGTRGKDSCNGDSGGPAIAMRDGKPWLVGILSIGSELPETDKSCGAEGRIAVYTSVEKYSNWIYAVMNNKDFCCRECPVIATRNPPYLSCTGPPLAPATSCVGAEGAVSSLVAGPTGSPPSHSLPPRQYKEYLCNYYIHNVHVLLTLPLSLSLSLSFTHTNTHTFRHICIGSVVASCTCRSTCRSISPLLLACGLVVLSEEKEEWEGCCVCSVIYSWPYRDGSPPPRYRSGRKYTCPAANAR